MAGFEPLAIRGAQLWLSLDCLWGLLVSFGAALLGSLRCSVDCALFFLELIVG